MVQINTVMLKYIRFWKQSCPIFLSMVTYFLTMWDAENGACCWMISGNLQKSVIIWDFPNNSFLWWRVNSSLQMTVSNLPSNIRAHNALVWGHMRVMASQIAGNSFVYTTTYSGQHQWNDHNSELLGPLWGEWVLINFDLQGSVLWKAFPVMTLSCSSKDIW